MLLFTAVTVPVLYKASVLDRFGRSVFECDFIFPENQHDPSVQFASSCPPHIKRILGCYTMNHQKSLIGSKDFGFPSYDGSSEPCFPCDERAAYSLMRVLSFLGFCR